MAEFNQILWALDREIQPRDFERLCVDLLAREGYIHIEPVGGTKDQGRDAEIPFWKGESAGRAVLAFQFSLEKTWERKLINDAAKIAKNCPGAVGMVFVTSQPVTGAKRDKLCQDFRTQRGWHFALFEREWLRHRLSEFHQDLAKKYFGLNLPPTVCHAAMQIELADYDDEAAKGIFQGTSPEMVRASVIECTRREPSAVENWRRLARLEYLLRNYDAAIEAINSATQFASQDGHLKLNLELFKASMLAEKGIADGSRPLLIQAKEVFENAVGTLRRAEDHYNLANVLGALGDLDESRRHYRRSLELKPENARTWKNYGSLCINLGDHDFGMQCFEKALKLHPNLVEAHLSKATALLLFFGQADEAIASFQRAYAISPTIDRNWKYIRYWYSRALLVAKKPEEALRQIEIEFMLRPGDKFLLDQKASILSNLRTHNPVYEEKARKFMEFRSKAISNDYEGLAQLIDIYKQRGRPDDAWKAIDRSLAPQPFSLRDIANKAGMTIDDFRLGFKHAHFYRIFRRDLSVEDHYKMLLGHGLRPNRKIIPALNQALIVPFGMTVQQMIVSSNAGFKNLNVIWIASIVAISKLLPVFGSHWIAPERPSDREDRVNLLALGLLHIFDVVVAEAARQFAYVAARCEIPQGTIEKAQTGDWHTNHGDVAASLFKEVALEWELVKPS
jgi:tetratricopeptide (TPR) repeat protein